jgi:hypothetical protein
LYKKPNAHTFRNPKDKLPASKQLKTA